MSTPVLSSVCCNDIHGYLGQAKACKEDGNHYFKEKQYKKAISSYSAGVKVEFDDDELKAVMYTNRATCHYNMGEWSVEVQLEEFSTMGKFIRVSLSV